MFSKKHRQQQQELHDAGSYGCGGNPDANYPAVIRQLADAVKAEDILDYGAGSKLALKPYFFDYHYTPYDVIDDLYHIPRQHDLVICVDVLEHVEPKHLHDVLDHLEGLTLKALFASIHTGPANKTLSDGRNAHLIQQPMDWWMPKFFDRFDVQQMVRVSEMEFFIIATVKNSS
jgi:hypothetical protein